MGSSSGIKDSLQVHWFLDDAFLLKYARISMHSEHHVQGMDASKTLMFLREMNQSLLVLVVVTMCSHYP